jgi:hypothetical protein
MGFLQGSMLNLLGYVLCNPYIGFMYVVLYLKSLHYVLGCADLDNT